MVLHEVKPCRMLVFFMQLYLYIKVFESIHTCGYKHVYVYVSVCLYVCVYVYVCIYFTNIESIWSAGSC